MGNGQFCDSQAEEMNGTHSERPPPLEELVEAIYYVIVNDIRRTHRGFIFDAYDQIFPYAVSLCCTCQSLRCTDRLFGHIGCGELEYPLFRRCHAK